MHDQVTASVRFLCDQFVAWQAPTGGIDPALCPYHRQTLFHGKDSAFGQDMPWLVRALYSAGDMLHEQKYLDAATRYAVFYIACLGDRSHAWALGGGIDPCLSLYRSHHPSDDALFDLYQGYHKARDLYRWLLGYRTQNGNYIDCGYPWHDDHGVCHEQEDVGFCGDLCEPLRALPAYYRLYGDAEALAHARGLARYFVSEFEPGTMNGIWSSKLGTWLIGPRHCSGFENLVGVYADESGWSWLSYFACLSLMRLYDALPEDDSLKAVISDRCVRSLRWMLETCQWPDGALGMTGLDDKWLGMTAMAVLQYVEMQGRHIIDGETQRALYPLAWRAWTWLQHMSQPAHFPADGYVMVSGRSKPWPGWNTVWLLAHTAEGLMAGATLEAIAPLQ